MAIPTTLPFKAGALYLESSTTPGTYNKLCGFDKLEFSIEKEKNDTTIPDCDDPDAPAWIQRDVVSLSGGFKASGILAKESFPEIRAAMLSTVSQNCRLLLSGLGSTVPLPNHRMTGKFFIDVQIAGERGNKFQIDITGESDGEIIMADVAA